METAFFFRDCLLANELGRDKPALHGWARDRQVLRDLLSAFENGGKDMLSHHHKIPHTDISIMWVD